MNEESRWCLGRLEGCVAKPSSRCKINRVLVVLVAIVYVLQLTLYYYTSPIHTLNSKRQDVEVHFFVGLQDKANKTSANQTKVTDSFNASKTLKVQSGHSQNLAFASPSSELEKGPTNTHDNCYDFWCTSVLDRSSYLNFQLCMSLVESGTHRDPLMGVPKRCQFRSSEGHDPVAFVSVPGSGNTWVRGLLEMATGICTGSIYCDIPLVAGGFVGELVHDGSVLFIKTHTSDAQWKGVPSKKRNIPDAFYTSAIVLMRNPFDTFVCERHRFLLNERTKEDIKQNVLTTDLSHLGEVGLEEFTNQSNWNSFVQNMTARWKKTLLEWVTPEHPVLVVRYEDVRRKRLSVVEKMLTFLNVPYHQTELKARLKDGFSEFKRHHQTSRDNHRYYSPSQIKDINRMIFSTARTIKKRGINLLVEDYFRV